MISAKWGVSENNRKAKYYAITRRGSKAFAEHQEAVKGSIEPGKLADLVVLSDDIFSIPPEAIEKTRVEMTIFDGKVIYQRK